MNHRTIKSFVLRAGRTSQRQERALGEWLADYQLVYNAEKWDLGAIFNREAKTVIEIGFGMGRSLVEMALANPEINYLGIEVHEAGVGSLVADLHEQNIKNVKVVMHDAVEVLTHCIPDNSLHGVQIFFPDPWPKKKHHKRRIIQTPFIELLSRKLNRDGFIHCATDWENYAQFMLEILSASPTLKNKADNGFIPRPSSRPLTKFENRGVKLGHGVWDLMFLKK